MHNIVYCEHPQCRRRGSMKRGGACRRGRLRETVNWRQRAQLRRASVSSHVRELEIRRSCSTLYRFYMTIRFKFRVFFAAINRRFYIRNILRNYRRADEEVGTGTIRLRDRCVKILLKPAELISSPHTANPAAELVGLLN
jgi:hypothetical protein